MRFVVDILELLADKVRIDLRRGDVRMAEHFLNGVDIGAVFQQMRREGMAQRVRRDRLFDAGLGLIVLCLLYTSDAADEL